MAFLGYCSPCVILENSIAWKLKIHFKIHLYLTFLSVLSQSCSNYMTYDEINILLRFIKHVTLVLPLYLSSVLTYMRAQKALVVDADIYFPTYISGTVVQSRPLHTTTFKLLNLWSLVDLSSGCATQDNAGLQLQLFLEEKVGKNLVYGIVSS